jgi:hypothetical protein
MLRKLLEEDLTIGSRILDSGGCASQRTPVTPENLSHVEHKTLSFAHLLKMPPQEADF